MKGELTRGNRSAEDHEPNAKPEDKKNNSQQENNSELEKDNALEEWKTCNETISKFDNILIDLRKYGFSIATGLMTAGSFLGLQGFTEFQPFQIVIIFATMALIDVLYWLDVYYQTILTAVILRTQVLEKKLGFGIDTYISRFYLRHRIGKALHLLYIGFLVSLLIIGGYIVHTNNLDVTTKIPLPVWILFLSFPIIFVLSIWAIFDRARYRTFTEAQTKVSNYIRKPGHSRDNQTLDQEIMKFLDTDNEEFGIDLEAGEWVEFDVIGSRRLSKLFWSYRLIITSKKVYGVKSSAVRHIYSIFTYDELQIMNDTDKNKDIDKINGRITHKILKICESGNDEEPKKTLDNKLCFEIKIPVETREKIIQKINEIKTSQNSSFG